MRRIAGVCVALASLVSASAAIAAPDLLIVEFQDKRTTLESNQPINPAFKANEAAQDEFTVRTTAPCKGVQINTVTVDLSPAKTALAFQPAPRADAGVIKVLDGGRTLAAQPVLSDNGRSLTLYLKNMTPGDRLVFDVPVVMTQSTTGQAPLGNAMPGYVTAREFEGVTVAAKVTDAAGHQQSLLGAFGNQGFASLPWNACPSVRGNGGTIAPVLNKPVGKPAIKP